MTASSVPVSSLTVTIPGAPTAFRLHAGEFANLFYQLDCLARTTRCSRAAYGDLWSRTLGGLDEGDREALTRWKKLRERYGGRIERHDDSHDLVLPVHRPGRQISSRLRLAGYSADSAAHYGDHLSLFADPADVAEAVWIVGRFAPRFGTWWPTQRAPLARSIDAYAKLFAHPDVQATLVEVAQFYRPVFPKGHVMDIDLIARPPHDSSTSGELVGMHSLVEVVDGEPAEGRFSVILHEIFHGWFSSAGDKALVDLAGRFAASPDIDAAAAYSLLDEGLATANGNGKIARLVSPDDYARRNAQPRGLYNDTLVDGMAKAELAAMDRHAAGTASDHHDHRQAGEDPVQVPASQQTPCPQLGTPAQLTLHAAPEQLTRPLHEAIPVHLTVVSVAVLETSAAQARAPAQSTVHVLPLHAICCAQESGFLHWMSHEDASHAIGPVHEPSPAHATLHVPTLHAICCVHEPAPSHLTVHALAALQSIDPVHVPAPMQVTAHGMPGGQTMGFVHVPAAVHTIAQVPLGSHVPRPASAQRAGHTSAASTRRASPASTSESRASSPASGVALSSAVPSGDMLAPASPYSPLP